MKSQSRMKSPLAARLQPGFEGLDSFMETSAGWNTVIGFKVYAFSYNTLPPTATVGDMSIYFRSSSNELKRH